MLMAHRALNRIIINTGKGRMAKKRYGIRNQNGAEIMEFAAAISILVPIFILIVYITYEASMYMYLKRVLMPPLERKLAGWP